MVVWLIGLSGAGKTTLAREVVRQCKAVTPNVVLIDGDEVRALYGNDLGYSMEDRRRNADRICRLCKFLEDQGILVVCAILSLFPESQEWNRANFKEYYEVFIDTPLPEMQARDVKGIYGRYARGEIREVAGLDLEFPRPNADLVIQNDGQLNSLLAYAPKIVEKMTGCRA